MTFWLIWLFVLFVGSFLTGIVRKLLDVKTTSSLKYGIFFYDVFGIAIDVLIGYCLLSALAGHWLK